MNAWITDQFKQAAIRADRVPGAVRIEIKRSGKERTLIVLPPDDTQTLISRLQAATGKEPTK